MSLYEMHKALRSIDRRPNGVQLFKDQPSEFLSEFDLSDRERRALTVVDPWEMLDLGVHPIFIRHLTRHLGVPHSKIYALERGQGWLEPGRSPAAHS